MSNLICVLASGNYITGALILLNSLCAAGFRGAFVIGTKGDPTEVENLIQAKLRLTLDGIEISVRKFDGSRHPNFQKAFFFRKVIQEFPDKLRYFVIDADIVVLGRWNFFESWADLGIAVVQDANFPWVGRNHPWRKDWKLLIERSNLTLIDDSSIYANGGFVGIAKDHVNLIDNWCRLCETFEGVGNSTAKIRQDARPEAFTGDQDILACALMTVPGPISNIGPEGMGFTGHHFLLSHAVENPKPWNKSFIIEALKGCPPTQAARMFLKFMEGPVSSFSGMKLAILRADYRLAKFISRLWRRAAP